VNLGPFPFPVAKKPGPPPPYRFLDATGLPASPGDCPLFTANDARVDAGDALGAVWRPVSADNEAAISINRGCLVVSGAPGVSVAAHTLRGLEVDAVFEISPGVDQMGAADYQISGAFVGVAGAAHGAAIMEVAGIHADVVYDTGPVTIEKVAPIVRGFSLDLTDPNLPVTPDDVDSSSPAQIVVPKATPVLVRVRRTVALGSSSLAAFVSLDKGYTWFPVTSTTVADDTTPAVVGIIGVAGMALSPRVRVFGVKYLPPAASIGIG
jgi:hypothetical protein